MNANEVKQYARERGADLVGIASIDRFKSLPAERNPLSIAPECRSVVVLARRILRGAMRGVEEGTNFSSTYGHFGHRLLEDNFMARTCYDLTCFIETQGYEAVPLFGYAPDGMATGVPVAAGKPAPNVIMEMEFAAQAAGLGEMGLGAFFITPQFGTRQRFCAILTDAELEPDPVSRKSLCGDCGACAAACPLGAIHLDERSPMGVPGAQMDVARVDYGICRTCPNGVSIAPGRGSRPDRIAAACGRACLVRLEQAGKLAGKFAQPFRKRTPWAMDSLMRPVPAEAGLKPTDIGCGGQAAPSDQKR